MSPTPEQRTRSHIQNVQRRRKYVLAIGFSVCVAVLLLTQSAWRETTPAMHRLIQMAGIALILICIVGRTWCTLYIGGLKRKQLVTLGPYSLVRNPLYFFTIIGTTGIGALAGSLTMTALFGLLVGSVFYAVALQEQTLLSNTFGSEFTDYAQRVPLFLPRLSGWQDADQLTVNPELVRQTFRDALWFLLAIPANMLIDWLHSSGALPVLAHLP